MRYRHKDGVESSSQVRVGIDLVSVKRVRKMLGDAPKAGNGRLLDLLGLKKFKRRLGAAQIARQWAAKEAFFKCLNLNQLMPDVLKDIEVKFLGTGSFVASYKAKRKVRIEAEGTVSRASDYVIAHVVLS